MAGFGESGQESKRAIKSSRLHEPFANDRLLPPTRLFTKVGQEAKYGTNFVPDCKRWRLWDVDPSTTDAERAANHVPLLQEQLKQAERWTQELGQPSRDTAPEWMKETLERWEREDL
jgi:hypothetical protein